jgi:hypothetical protein
LRSVAQHFAMVQLAIEPNRTPRPRSGGRFPSSDSPQLTA